MPGTTEYRPVDLIRILSLDVLAGALASGTLAVKVLGVQPTFSWWIVLPIAVWIIYTLDHLVDGMRLKENAHTPRHRFHYKYGRVISMVAGLLSILTGILVVLYFRKEMILSGLLILLMALFYLVFVWIMGKKSQLAFPKEFFVAGIYTLGIWVPLIIVSEGLTAAHWLILVSFFFITVMDVLIFSLFDLKPDLMDGHPSFTVRYGKSKTVLLIRFAGLINCLLDLSLIMWLTENHLILFASGIFILMSLILAFLTFRLDYFHRNKRYKLAGEGVFLLPALILLA